MTQSQPMLVLKTNLHANKALAADQYDDYNNALNSAKVCAEQALLYEQAIDVLKSSDSMPKTFTKGLSNPVSDLETSLKAMRDGFKTYTKTAERALTAAKEYDTQVAAYQTAIDALQVVEAVDNVEKYFASLPEPVVDLKDKRYEA